MSYHWNWAILLSQVSTGENATYLDWLLSGIAVTLGLAAASWVVALTIGVLFGIGRTLGVRWADWLGGAYVSLFRNVPLIVQLFAWYFVVPDILPRPLGQWFKNLHSTHQFFVAATVALGLFTAARICEQVRAAIEALPRGQRAAGNALGLSTWQTYRYVLLPVALRTILPPLTSEMLNLVKNTAIASTIGLLELTGQAQQLVDYTAQAYESFISVTVAYFVINGCIMLAMRTVEAKTRLPGETGRQG